MPGCYEKKEFNMIRFLRRLVSGIGTSLRHAVEPIWQIILLDWDMVRETFVNRWDQITRLLQWMLYLPIISFVGGLLLWYFTDTPTYIQRIIFFVCGGIEIILLASVAKCVSAFAFAIFATRQLYKVLTEAAATMLQGTNESAVNANKHIENMFGEIKELTDREKPGWSAELVQAFSTSLGQVFNLEHGSRRSETNADGSATDTSSGYTPNDITMFIEVIIKEFNNIVDRQEKKWGDAFLSAVVRALETSAKVAPVTIQGIIGALEPAVRRMHLSIDTLPDNFHTIAKEKIYPVFQGFIRVSRILFFIPVTMGIFLPWENWTAFTFSLLGFILYGMSVVIQDKVPYTLNKKGIIWTIVCTVATAIVASFIPFEQEYIIGFESNYVLPVLTVVIGVMLILFSKIAFARTVAVLLMLIGFVGKMNTEIIDSIHLKFNIGTHVEGIQVQTEERTRWYLGKQNQKTGTWDFSLDNSPNAFFKPHTPLRVIDEAKGNYQYLYYKVIELDHRGIPVEPIVERWVHAKALNDPRSTSNGMYESNPWHQTIKYALQPLGPEVPTLQNPTQPGIPFITMNGISREMAEQINHVGHMARLMPWYSERNTKVAYIRPEQVLL